MHKSKMNREQRRAAVADLRKKAKGGWEPLKSVHGVVGHPMALPGLVKAMNNHTYSVQVFAPRESALGTVIPVGVRRHDGGANFPWHDLQRIKDEVAGTDMVAVEVFPTTTDLVDEANMRWLMVLPAVERFPFPKL